MSELLTYMAAKLDVDVPNVDEDTLLSNGLGLAYFLAGVVCIIAIVIGGILYVTANGESGKIQTAKNAILYAVVGLVVILMAATITGFVISRVNG